MHLGETSFGHCVSSLCAPNKLCQVPHPFKAAHQQHNGGPSPGPMPANQKVWFITCSPGGKEKGPNLQLQLTRSFQEQATLCHYVIMASRGYFQLLIHYTSCH